MEDDIDSHEIAPFPTPTQVVDLGDIRVQRGFSRTPQRLCRHNQMIYALEERRIWCEDCRTTIDPFGAFVALAENHRRATETLNARVDALREAEAFAIRSIAAKKLDEAWRSQKMAPSCPHCHEALLPEDFKSGLIMTNKEWARACRQHRKKK